MIDGEPNRTRTDTKKTIAEYELNQNSGKESSFPSKENDDDDNFHMHYFVIKYTVEQGHIQGATVNGSSRGAAGADGGGVINVRAGSFIRIDLQISGSPIPTVTWLKDHQPILVGDRVR